MLTGKQFKEMRKVHEEKERERVKGILEEIMEESIKNYDYINHKNGVLLRGRKFEETLQKLDWNDNIVRIYEQVLHLYGWKLNNRENDWWIEPIDSES